MLDRRSRIVAVGLLAATVILGSSASPAQADRWVHRDATGDVASADGDEESLAPAPRNRAGDIRHVRVVHSQQAVRIVVQIRDMRRSGQVGLVMLKTPGNDLAAVAQVVRVNRRNSFYAYSIIRGEEGECPGASGRPRFEEDKFVVSIPRQCLGEPRWIRAAVLYSTSNGPRGRVVTIDDGLRSSVYRGARGYGWSPRVHAS